MRRFLSATAISLGMLLSGCATTFTGQVTTFHEWPQQLSSTSYIVERLPAQENNPEYKVYEEELRQQLGLHGFQEVATGATPALKVNMQYATSPSEIQYSMPWGPSMMDPYWRLHFSRAYQFYPYSPYYFGSPFYMLRTSDVTVRRYYLHQLEISISDFSNGNKLADIKASTEQLNPNITESMPYLIESALKNFPGQNGSTTNVEIPLNKN